GKWRRADPAQSDLGPGLGLQAACLAPATPPRGGGRPGRPGISLPALHSPLRLDLSFLLPARPRGRPLRLPLLGADLRDGLRHLWDPRSADRPLRAPLARLSAWALGTGGNRAARPL